MKKKFIGVIILWLALLFIVNFTAFAESSKKGQTDPDATNIAFPYPAVEEILPAMPVPPGNMKDAKAVTAYITAVDVYLKAAQKYIDGTTNDLNKIVEQRNLAVENANKAVEDYNKFIDTNKKK